MAAAAKALNHWNGKCENPSRSLYTYFAKYFGSPSNTQQLKTQNIYIYIEGNNVQCNAENILRTKIYNHLLVIILLVFLPSVCTHIRAKIYIYIYLVHFWIISIFGFSHTHAHAHILPFCHHRCASIYNIYIRKKKLLSSSWLVYYRFGISV